MGYELGQNALNEAFGRFKDLADKKKHVFDDDIVALVDDSPGAHDGETASRWSTLRVIAGTEGPQQAELKLTMVVDGEEHAADGHRRRPGRCGVQRHPGGSRRTRRPCSLFQVHAVTEGTDAQAQVSVRLEEDGRIATGQARQTPTPWWRPPRPM